MDSKMAPTMISLQPKILLIMRELEASLATHDPEPEVSLFGPPQFSIVFCMQIRGDVFGQISCSRSSISWPLRLMNFISSPLDGFAFFNGAKQKPTPKIVKFQSAKKPFEGRGRRKSYSGGIIERAWSATRKTSSSMIETKHATAWQEEANKTFTNVPLVIPFVACLTS